MFKEEIFLIKRSIFMEKTEKIWWFFWRNKKKLGLEHSGPYDAPNREVQNPPQQMITRP